ncbi:MAG: T9SS type A sorting domain-containing protein [Candidatus Latescibacteria bacterium]|nr:T9SS type A sorting domain-containing protein [Candidatus Latescibacterota bacterium]
MQRVIVGLLLVVLVGGTQVAGQEVEIHLSKIDEGVSWVSSYWGYNAPKLAYDGESYYSVGLWGTEQATAQGALYQLRDGQWHKGYQWDGLNYQPGMVLLDGQRRVILIYPKNGEKPVILRATSPGQIDEFEPLEVPDRIGKAGYMGAGIYDERLVIGYIGDPATYTFQTAILDLRTGTWDGPFILAPAQRQQVPWTTWLYPVIQPDETGYHLLVSNQPDSRALYNRILYMHLPYGDPGPIEPEVVAEIEPEGNFMAFGEAMWHSPDGCIYVTGQYQGGGQANRLFAFVRDVDAGTWSGGPLGNAQVAAAYQRPGGIGAVWVASTYGSQLRLYKTADHGGSWEVEPVVDLGGYGLVSSFFLHGISPSSGSLVPSLPTAVFSAGAHPNYQLWFAQFDIAQVDAPTVVEETATTVTGQPLLAANAPNPFNNSTVMRFWLPAPGSVDLAVYNLRGQRVGQISQGYREGGWHAVTWAADGLATGGYFYRLRTGETVLTRKLALVR